jgi:hypothetical protein
LSSLRSSPLLFFPISCFSSVLFFYVSSSFPSLFSFLFFIHLSSFNINWFLLFRICSNNVRRYCDVESVNFDGFIRFQHP